MLVFEHMHGCVSLTAHRQIDINIGKYDGYRAVPTFFRGRGDVRQEGIFSHWFLLHFKIRTIIKKEDRKKGERKNE